MKYALAKNGVAGLCRCGARVPAGAGRLSGPPWRILCEPCASGGPARGPRIQLEDGGAAALARPASYLGARDFEAYRRAYEAAGGAFNRDLKCAAVAPLAVPALVRALEAAGFQVSIHPELRASLQARAAEARADLEAAAGRASAIEDWLRSCGRALFPYQREGVEWLAPLDRALLGDDMGLGKQQPIDARVATPVGWRAIGDLAVGDFVIGSDGLPAEVVAVYPQGVEPSFRVSFSDGSSVEAGPEHIWAIDYRRGGREWSRLVLTTEQLRARPVVAGLDLAKTALYLPMLSEPIHFVDGRRVPIGGYTMGALLANGCLGHGTPQLTYAAGDWPEIAGHIRAEGSAFGEPRRYANCVHSNIRGATEIVRALEIDVASRVKRIPRIYQTAPIAERIALLHGLMDADGTISAERNRVTYCTTSAGLAEDVRELVEGLGGTAHIRRYVRSDGKPDDFQIAMKLPIGVRPFSLARKAARFAPRSRSVPHRIVTSVEYVRDVESVCIAVDAPDRLYVTERCILTHNTVQALVALPDGAPVLVVGPPVAKAVWRRHVADWRPDLTPVVLRGRGSFRWPRSGEAVITAYPILPRAPEEVEAEDAIGEIAANPLISREEDDLFSAARGGAPSEPVPGTVLIADEAHAVKNPKAARTMRTRALAEAVLARGGRCWLLTATPMLNKPDELWAVLETAGLGQAAFGSFWRFVHGFGGWRDRRGDWNWSEPGPAIAEGLRRVMLRRMKRDVLKDLPPKIFREVEVEIDLATRRICDRAIEALAAAGISLAEILEAEANAASTIEGAAFEEMSAARAALAKAKIAAALDLVEEYEEAETPIVVFSAHRAPIEALAARPGWGAILGGVSEDARERVQDDFQGGRLRGVACTIRAGGVAITLTRAQGAIFVDRDYSPLVTRQAEDRIHRIGQEGSVVITRLVADHELDRRLAEIEQEKLALIDGSVDAAASSSRPSSAAREALEALEKIAEGGKEP